MSLLYKYQEKSETYINYYTVSTNGDKMDDTHNINNKGITNLITLVDNADGAIKKYVDNGCKNRGDAMSGDLNMGGNYVTNIANNAILRVDE